MRSPLRHFRLALIVWVGYSAYRIAQTALLAALGVGAAMSASHRALYSVLDGAMLALATPVLIAAADHFPVERPHRARNVLVNSSLALAFALAALLLLFTVSRLLREQQPLSLLIFSAASLTDELFTFLVVAALAQAVVYERRLRARELHAARLESQLTAARLESLTAQLHPHFLFNTLNGISELIYTSPTRADAVVLGLARFLRATLDRQGQEVRLAEELETLDGYLDIQRMRFHDRLTTEVDVDPAAFDARVPSFLLQPLVENAIRHGIAPRAAPGVVAINASVYEQTLTLEVLDDGVGLAPGANEGVGLRNTRRRLAELYPNAHEFSIRPRAGGGTEVAIVLPLKNNRA